MLFNFFYTHRMAQQRNATQGTQQYTNVKSRASQQARILVLDTMEQLLWYSFVLL